MASQQPYQGYPYVQPVVNDVPSITADAAARWQHLPRRQVDAVKGESVPDRSGSIPAKRYSNMEPVVYIDMPEVSGSTVSDRRRSDAQETEILQSKISTEESKSDPDAPVVYIDMPESSGSIVAQDRDRTPQEEPAFVQDTIFYDPFENRRIDHAKEEANDSDDDSEAGPRPQFVPRRPNTLDVNGAGTSAVSSTGYPSSSGMPSFMSKEVSLYGQTDSNGFPASPIPVSQFPEPPPAYAEIDTVNRVEQPVVDPPVVEQPSLSSPPRTQVILPVDATMIPTMPIGMPNPDRKYMNCQHCGQRVHTLVVKENGMITHLAAFACLLLCVLPCVVLIYCTDYLKVTNHYCPNCNQVIGHELPIASKKIIYEYE